MFLEGGVALRVKAREQYVSDFNHHIVATGASPAAATKSTSWFCMYGRYRGPTARSVVHPQCCGLATGLSRSSAGLRNTQLDPPVPVLFLGVVLFSILFLWYSTSLLPLSDLTRCRTHFHFFIDFHGGLFILLLPC